MSGAHNRVRIRSGDKGYDADSYIESLQKRGIQVVMPPKAIAKSNVNDFALYNSDHRSYEIVLIEHEFIEKTR